jgi:hypothetical protein
MSVKQQDYERIDIKIQYADSVAWWVWTIPQEYFWSKQENGKVYPKSSKS